MSVLGALSQLGVTLPVWAAPMAGGPTTSDLVIAVSRVGGLGFLAGGYKTRDTLADQIRIVRSHTERFGVNLFAPNPVPVNPAAYGRYLDELRPDAERFGVTLPDKPLEDDDGWQDKIDLLTTEPVPVVSFTFGIPHRSTIARLQAMGTFVIQTITSSEEAARAAESGADALVVQGSAAGGHSGTLTPSSAPVDRPLSGLVAEVRARVELPLIAAGGIGDPIRVAEALQAGAETVTVGTALLLSTEAGTSAPHRAALSGPDRGPTLVTRAFSGRPARALRNAFVDAHHPDAPSGYPAIHHLTSPVRRAAVAAGNPEYVNLWAGSGHRSAVPGSVGGILEGLASRL